MITRHKLKDMGLNLETLTIMSMPNMINSTSPSNHHHTNSNLNLCGSKRTGGQELPATPPVSIQSALWFSSMLSFYDLY